MDTAISNIYMHDIVCQYYSANQVYFVMVIYAQVKQWFDALCIGLEHDIK